MRRLNVIGAAVAGVASLLILTAPIAAADGETGGKRPLATPQDGNTVIGRPLVVLQDDTGGGKRPLATPQDGNTHFPRPL